MYCFALLALDCRMVRANRQVEGDAAYRQAIELLQHNQPAQAIPLLNIAIALMPDIASVRWDRARAHVSLGQYDMALQDSNHAVKMEPKNKIALMVRSTVFRSMSDDRHAVEDLSRVLELDPKNAMVYNNRAWSYNALGNYDAALNDATRAIELNRNLSTSYDTRAVAYLMTNRPNEAIADLNKVSRLKRNDASSAYHLAVAYKQLGKTDLAEESTQVAKRLGYKPESWEAKL
jgi:tetratricopeptide (TPR) repeat protein